MIQILLRIYIWTPLVHFIIVYQASNMDTSESEYGLTLTLHSNANKDVYKDNNPSAFTNLLKIPVKLNQNDNYEVSLANFHSPKTQGLLLKRSDFRKK